MPSPRTPVRLGRTILSILVVLAAVTALVVSSTRTSHGPPVRIRTVPVPSPTHSCDPSGQPMPVGNIPGWDQIVADNFCNKNVRLGSFPQALSQTWSAYPDGFHDTEGNGIYDCTLVCSVHNGVLDLWLHTVDGVHYVAVPYPLLPGDEPKNGVLYGRYVVRFKADPVPGYKTAWLLWADEDKNSNKPGGEIDFPEGNLTGDICAFMHSRGTSGQQDAYCTSTAESSGWHTATIEWTASAVTFILDGQVVGVSSNPAVIPDTPMHWVLQTETALFGPPPTDTASGHVYVAWVAIYRPALTLRPPGSLDS